jgi:hypothetical protein
MGGQMIGFWGALFAALVVASVWDHVLQFAELRPVGAHAGLTLATGVAAHLPPSHFYTTS